MSKQEARLILLLLGFMMDSVLTNYLPFSYSKEGIMMASNIGMMFFIFLIHFMNQQDRMVYAIGVGLYYSIIYGKSLLIYVLIYALIGFLGGLYERVSSFTFVETLPYVLVMITIKELAIYLLVLITNVTDYAFHLFIQYRLLPSLGLNALIFILAYYFFKIYQGFVKSRGYDC